jgi:hypothetical protein
MSDNAQGTIYRNPCDVRFDVSAAINAGYGPRKRSMLVIARLCEPASELHIAEDSSRRDFRRQRRVLSLSAGSCHRRIVAPQMAGVDVLRS